MGMQQGIVRALFALATAVALGGCADTAFDRSDEGAAYEGLPAPRYYGYGYGSV